MTYDFVRSDSPYFEKIDQTNLNGGTQRLCYIGPVNVTLRARFDQLLFKMAPAIVSEMATRYLE